MYKQLSLGVLGLFSLAVVAQAQRHLPTSFEQAHKQDRRCVIAEAYQAADNGRKPTGVYNEGSKCITLEQGVAQWYARQYAARGIPVPSADAKNRAVLNEMRTFARFYSVIVYGRCIETRISQDSCLDLLKVAATP